jgi:hypothetical protein
MGSPARAALPLITSGTSIGGVDRFYRTAG